MGENELARLVGHLPQWDLHRGASGEAQMEVSRCFQAIKMVGMRWRERDAPNGGRKPEFGGGAPAKPDFPTRASLSFFKLLWVVPIVLEAS